MIVVLVEPENPRNIGFVARAMRVSGLSELRLVNPAGDFDEAYITGKAGKDILDAAGRYSTLDEAIADASTAVAFTRRGFSEVVGDVALAELSQKIDSKTALVFGRESQGLSREEVVRCSLCCHIPTDTTVSYNLGQAVAISLYELCNRSLKKENIAREEQPSIEEKQAFFSLLSGSVENSFLAKGDREIQLRKIIEKMGVSQKELHLLMGVIKSAAGTRKTLL